MLSTSPISLLPEELLLLIFNQLDSPPPSELNSRREPSLLFTAGFKGHIYKDLSLVSRRWRRIVVPLLFKYSRLELVPGTRNGRHTEGNEINDKPTIVHTDDPAAFDARSKRSSAIESWLDQPRHCLMEYLDFIESNNLAWSVQKFVLVSDPLPSTRSDSSPVHNIEDRNHRYEAAGDFWYRIFSKLRPAHVVIVAPPADMAFWTNAGVGTDSAWAFADMDFHILELKVADSASLYPPPRSVDPMDFIPRECPSLAPASILKLQPWTHIALNEGSFLKAYGTYEYFEHGPPSLIYSIKTCLASPRVSRFRGPSSEPLTALRSFRYTAILPFANHVDFRTMLHNIEELDVKLAPDPDFPLTDKDRIGRAELEDCWQEFFSAYRLIVAPFRTFDILRDVPSNLKRFVCQDIHIAALRPDLDDEFTALCLPVWTEPNPGVFERQFDLPAEYRIQDL